MAAKNKLAYGSDHRLHAFTVANDVVLHLFLRVMVVMMMMMMMMMNTTISTAP